MYEMKWPQKEVDFKNVIRKVPFVLNCMEPEDMQRVFLTIQQNFSEPLILRQNIY